MKGFSFLILLTILVVSDYALAGNCPCDTEQLSNGLTGNDIVHIDCPDGQIAEGNIWVLNPGVVAIGGEFTYQVLSTDPPICEITDFINPPVDVKLTDEQLEGCRARLIQGCKLILETTIPTLNEWGMMAMAGALGIIGMVVASRRRKAAA